MRQKRKRILIIYTGGTIGMMKTRHGYAPQKEKFHQLLDAIPELKADGMPEWEVVESLAEIMLIVKVGKNAKFASFNIQI